MKCSQFKRKLRLTNIQKFDKKDLQHDGSKLENTSRSNAIAYLIVRITKQMKQSVKQQQIRKRASVRVNSELFRRNKFESWIYEKKNNNFFLRNVFRKLILKTILCSI